MSDDEPQASKNPFIKFKRHVDSRIGTGLSILTGTSFRTDTATTGANTSMSSTSTHPTSVENMDRVPKPPASSSWSESLLGRRHESFDSYSATRQHCNEWAQLSPYSPYNLRHLPRPVPAGASSKDAGLFDFGDAFEDLLAVSSGRDLMDLRKQADYKRRILDIFHFGEPPMLWVNRLSARRLLPESLPPRNVFEMSYDSAAAETPWGVFGQGSEILKGVEAHQQKLRTVEKQRSVTGDAALPSPKQQNQQWENLIEKMLKEADEAFSFPEKMVRQVEGMVKNLEDMFEKTARVVDSFDLDKFLQNEARGDAWTAEQKAQSQQKPAPDTEEDWFSALFGDLTESEKPPPAKSVAKDPHRDEARWSCKPSERAEEVEYDENGGKTFTTSTEHVDMFGYVHQQTEVRRHDANGRQISCETKLIVRPAVEKELRKPIEERETESPASDLSGEKHKVSTVNQGKSTGWFWR